jgi:hypothetical protein
VKALLALIDSVEFAQSYVDRLITEIVEMESMSEFSGREPRYIELKNCLVAARENERRFYQRLKPVIDRAMDPPLFIYKPKLYI